MKKKMTIAHIEVAMNKYGADNIYMAPDGKIYHRPTKEAFDKKSRPVPAPRKARMPKTCLVEFANKIARAMMKINSSHVYFIVQQAYKGKRWGKFGERLSWKDVTEICKEVIDESGRYFKAQGRANP